MKLIHHFYSTIVVQISILTANWWREHLRTQKVYYKMANIEGSFGCRSQSP